ncbi:hypothetical protein, partial [uncultured Varibaculum sp.]
MSSSRIGARILAAIITYACFLLLPIFPAQIAIAKAAENDEEGKITTAISAISPDTLSYSEDAASKDEK